VETGRHWTICLLRAAHTPIRQPLGQSIAKRNHESTIDLGLVPDSSRPLSLDDVSGDSIRPVAHALIFCTGQAQSIDRWAVERTQRNGPPGRDGVKTSRRRPRCRCGVELSSQNGCESGSLRVA